MIIPVAIPSEESAWDTAKIDITVSLADGGVSPVDPAAWEAALATGRTVLARQIAAEAAAKAAFLAPLLGPAVNAEREWHDYLREGVGRLMGDEAIASTTVLRAPGRKDYAISEKWVRAALTDKRPGMVALASLSEPNLVSVLEKIASKLRDRSLADVTLFLALSDQYWPAAAAAMEHTGAKLVQLDPAEPIPQAAARIDRRYRPAPAPENMSPVAPDTTQATAGATP